MFAGTKLHVVLDPNSLVSNMGNFYVIYYIGLIKDARESKLDKSIALHGILQQQIGLGIAVTHKMATQISILKRWRTFIIMGNCFLGFSLERFHANHTPIAMETM